MVVNQPTVRDRSTPSKSSSRPCPSRSTSDARRGRSSRPAPGPARVSSTSLTWVRYTPGTSLQQRRRSARRSSRTVTERVEPTVLLAVVVDRQRRRAVRGHGGPVRELVVEPAGLDVLGQPPRPVLERGGPRSRASPAHRAAPAGRRSPGPPAGSARTPRPPPGGARSGTARGRRPRRRSNSTAASSGPSPGRSRRAPRPWRLGRARASSASATADRSWTSSSSSDRLGSGRCACATVPSARREPDPQRVVVGHSGVRARRSASRDRGPRPVRRSDGLVEVPGRVAVRSRRTSAGSGSAATSPVTGPCRRRVAVAPARDARRQRGDAWGAGTGPGGSAVRPARRARETTWMLRIESPPSSKKLSSTPTRSTPEHVGPDLARGPLGLGARRAVLTVRGRRPVGRGQPAPVHLSVGASAAARPALTNADGHHVVGQLARPGRRAAPPPAAPSRPGRARGRRPAACGRRPRGDDHDRLGDVGVARQRGLDLGRFDPEAADLDLVVGAPEELQFAVGVHRTTSPVRYIRVTGRSERVGHEALGGQRRAGPGSRGPARRRRCTAPPGRPAAAGCERAVQDVDADVVQGPSDGHRPRAARHRSGQLRRVANVVVSVGP